MLEIRGKEISELNDEDLRSLVGWLCEAELNSRGLPSAAVSWGGDQNAGDGGIDVWVDLSSTFNTDDFIPRNKTGFQVKKSDMLPSSILKEMRPKGKLRHTIIELAQAHGAYIIISGESSTSHTALTRRKQAMLKALSDLEQSSKLKIDYYDAERVAGWVRSHPAMILWVRSKIGKPIQGWLPYRNWANPKGGLSEEYIPDEAMRLYSTMNSSLSCLSLVEGINAMRQKLKEASAIIRFVGLSGVGKTRFIQALFDERIGGGALDKSQVCYTDISYEPNPEPVNFAQQLISLKKPIILVVDNCPPELHRALTTVCSEPGSLVRLLTVEYDVREDLPEETEVYGLEPASDQFIEKLIRKRQTQISRVDANTLSQFSGGNARLALALAQTVKLGDNLSNLKDPFLFERLFKQRKAPDKSLMRSAEICSLVYSFDSRTDSDEAIEMSLLSELAEKTIRSFSQDIAEIESRHLIQRRHHWKALLPHALANKLAANALKWFPLNDLAEIFEKKSSKRLLQSFSRRLGYLHESEEAKAIARRWLALDGLIGSLAQLNQLGINLLTNIAPIDPEATLDAIERGADLLSADHAYADELSRLLQSLAYDASLFSRAISLLCGMALTEDQKALNKPIHNSLATLFHIQLSGTHAPLEQRLAIIQELIDAKQEDRQQLGLFLLTAALEASTLRPAHNLSFGARSRDYGALNGTKADILYWYGTLLDYALVLIQNYPKLASNVMSILSDRMMGLWNNAKVHDKAEEITKQIIQSRAWNEGWLAVRKTLRTVGKNMPEEVVTRLRKLETILEPKVLIDRARAYALTPSLFTYFLYEEEDPSIRTKIKEDKLKATTRHIGQEVADNPEVFAVLLPELLCQDGVGIFELGQGLADHSPHPLEMWQDYCAQLALIEPEKCNFKLLGGFLDALCEGNRALVEQLLDEAVEHSVLAKMYPYLQARAKINDRGVARLKRSITLELAPISNYEVIGLVGALASTSDVALLSLLNLIMTKPGGNKVAISVLRRRLFFYTDAKQPIGDELLSGSRHLLINYQFSKNDRHSSWLDHELAEIFKIVFSGKEARQQAQLFGENIVRALGSEVVSYLDFPILISAFVTHQPAIFLEAFMQEDLIGKSIIGRDFFSGSGLDKRTPADLISEEIVIAWCEVDPVKRYLLLAHIILPYIESDDDSFDWNPLALKVLERASDTKAVLNLFEAAFDPDSWSGSLLNLLIKGATLVVEFKDHSNAVISAWAKEYAIHLLERIEQVQENQAYRRSFRKEGFE